MTTETATPPVVDPTHAARLERLAARRDRGNPTVPGEALAPPSVARSSIGRTDVDAALADRLDRLAAARAERRQLPPTGRTTAPTKKRRHPAKHSRTAALTLSVLASGGLGLLFASTDPGAAAAPAAPVGVVPAATSPTTATPASATPQAATSPNASAPIAASGNAVDTTTAPVPAPTAPADPVTINGQSFPNKWGDVQVQATFDADGRLTAVDAVQVPFRDGKSVRINDRAVPRLNSEALSAQSASIDTVSGATYTSVGYQQSLQSAIDIAVANGVPAPASA
jgi:uncharacterized protein with FMN-binding domain